MLPCRFIIEFVPHSGRRARSSNPALRAVGSLLSHRTSPSVSVRRSAKLEYGSLRTVRFVSSLLFASKQSRPELGPGSCLADIRIVRG